MTVPCISRIMKQHKIKILLITKCVSEAAFSSGWSVDIYQGPGQIPPHFHSTSRHAGEKG